ncbi:hypothetical protein CMQ_4266 [Grosmannia clavigera kw1407]|uniref:Uncharacterized protein n=1 Tax=Grosmannia clavigera (strain kw1407 / UAMH 11150) TaxID=655863 RepID=F0XTQ7_GROCL|nr:uncharacterized protein CMQ_4266 [Grosmannia clavigera kw1407]EFW98414.1 hypothetical protein CMQ_4266 [Grosmannia clavigera kw1407]
MTATTAPEGAAWSEAAISISWNQVVSDYKAFHGVRARGGTVDDLPENLREPVLPDSGQETRPDAKPETVNGSVGETKQAAAAETTTDGERATSLDKNGPAAAPAAESDAELEQTFASPSGTNQLPAPSLMPPQAVLGSMDGNESLKKLLMSWYYAGYYTGLHEGQQQAAQGQPEGDQHAENEAQP